MEDTNRLGIKIIENKYSVKPDGTSNIVPWVGGGIPSSPNHKIYCDDDRRGAWWYHRYDIRMLFWSRSVHHVFQQQLHCQRYEYHYLVFMHHYHFYLTTMLSSAPTPITPISITYELRR